VPTFPPFPDPPSQQTRATDNHATSATVTNQTYPRQRVESKQRSHFDNNDVFTKFQEIRDVGKDIFDAPKLPIVRVANSDFWGAPVYETDGGLWCPGFEGKTFADNPWDLVKLSFSAADRAKHPDATGLGSTFTPGICRVTVSKGRTVDKKKSSGTDGDTLTISGINSAEGEIQVMLWTPEQWEWWKHIWPIMSPPQGKHPTDGTTVKTTVGKGTAKIFVQAYDVQHPKFAMHGIKSVVFLHGNGPDDGWVTGAKFFTAKWVEYIEPIKTTVTRTIKGADAKDSAYGTNYVNDNPGNTSEGTNP
jgi:hypothetical protein